jgi:hypothetical protein
MVKKRSLILAESFHLQLPDDIVALLDSEIWIEDSRPRFGAALAPEEIRHRIWGGSMLPDTLPLSGNGFGDYLCLRINTDGTLREVLAWFHEGAFWTPYGNTLCEALLLDAALGLKEEPTGTELEDEPHRFDFANWAKSRLDAQAALRLNQGLFLDDLLAAGLAETAVRRERCSQHLASGLSSHCRQVGGGRLAEKLGVEWPEFSRWLLDTELIPDKFKSKLGRITRMPAENLLRQNWDGAIQEAETVSKLRPDLAWPFAVMGWGAERENRLDVAVRQYYAGLKTLHSSADFTADWRLTDPPGFGKFVIERLRTLPEAVRRSDLEDGYLQAALAGKDQQEVFQGIRRYWVEEGQRAEEEGHPDRAYWCYYSAGWDLYCFDDVPEILVRLVRTARSAGWPALARLAQAHLEQIP